MTGMTIGEWKDCPPGDGPAAAHGKRGRQAFLEEAVPYGSVYREAGRHHRTDDQYPKTPGSQVVSCGMSVMAMSTITLQAR